MSLNKLSATALVVGLSLLCLVTSVGARLVDESSKPAAALRGAVAGYHWTAEVRHGKEAGASPCVSVVLVKRVRGSLGAKNTVCGSFSPFPLLSGASEGTARGTRAVVGMVFDVDVTKVRVSLRGRTTRNLWLHLLTKAEAGKGHVKTLRYGAIAFSGATCVGRIVPFYKEDGGWREPGFGGDCGRR